MKPLRLALALFPLACTTPKLVGEGESTGEPTTDDPTATEGMTSATDPSATGPIDIGDTGEVPNDGRYVDCADLGPGEGTVGGGDVGPLGFPPLACNPRTSGVSGTGHKCCSSDPSTADGQLPSYEGKAIDGSASIYADAANGAGTWGMCVNVTEIPAGFGLLADDAENCPIPCNPTWDNDSIAQVCGQGRVCCQTIELGPKDCVQDETGTWRPVTGADIGSDEITPITNWNSVVHDTHQDPNGTVCLALNGDDQLSPGFRECILHLNVADQRGFCMGIRGACPGDSTTYVDACEAMNE